MKNLVFLILMGLLGSRSTLAVSPPVTLQDPKYPGTDIPFAYVGWNCPTIGTCPSGASFSPARDPYFGGDYYVNEDGVCKVLGFESAVANSSQYAQGSNSDRRIQMDSGGALAGAVAGVTLSEIKCLNPISVLIPKTVTRIDYPIHPTTLLHFSREKTGYAYEIANDSSTASDENRVCVILGHASAVPMSSLSGNGPVADEFGTATQITSSDQVNLVDAYIMQSIMCID